MSATFSQYTSNFSNSINGSFYWYKKVLYQKLKEKVAEFLLTDFNLKLIGISEKDNILFDGEDFFVTRIKVDKQNEVYLRISGRLMEMMLETSLGKKNEQFAPEKITELEAKILTSLNDFVFKGLTPFMVKREPDECDNKNLAHLTFIAKNNEGTLGKYILSVPVSLLPEPRAITPQQMFDMGSFPKYPVLVKIITGKSELTLFDIQHIEPGDIVVLENSNIKKMTIEVNGKKKTFAINPDTSIISGTGIDNNGGIPMTDNNEATMWDVIPVEIVAEFEGVKISLGELKQISEGIIVDVGSIYENKILLKVENKTIASGELIIINDKYAVRVDEVYAEQPKKTAPKVAESVPQMKPLPSTQPQLQDQPEQNDDDDDDFNYDNFDIEDEDI